MYLYGLVFATQNCTLVNSWLDACRIVTKMLEVAKANPTRFGNPLEWKGYMGATPLHAACRNSHLDIVMELIKQGADVTKKSVNSYLMQHVSYRYI